MKKIILLLVILLLLTATGFAREKMPPQGCSVKIFEELDLSKEQIAQMKNNFEKNKKQHDALRKELGEKHQLLAKELAKNISDQTVLAQIVADIKNMQNQMVDQRVADLLAIKKILTPEQYAKFIDREKKMMKRMSRHKPEPPMADK